MSATNDGGPAFPRNGFEARENGHREFDSHPHSGMTLRDWFAGMALASAVHLGSKALTVDQMAQTMYIMADAMLSAREANNAGDPNARQ